MNKTLKQLADEAIDLFNEYRNPDLSEFIQEIDKVLVVMGNGTVGDDKILNIHYRDSYDGNTKYLEIYTEYYVRQCRQTNTFNIPVDIIESDDPVKSITKLILEQSIEKHNSALKGHFLAIEKTTKILIELQIRLALLDKGIKINPQEIKLFGNNGGFYAEFTN